MRITQSTLSQNSLAGINRNLNQLNNLQNQLTSGKRLNQPSDSPTGTNSSLQIRGALAANTQYAANMSDGKTWLDTADSTLQSMISQAQRVRDLTVQAMNSGAVSNADDQDIAAEVDQLHASLLGLANTQIEGRPVFGGATGGSVAYSVTTDPATGKVTGSSYVGVSSANGVTRRITDSATVRVDTTGTEAFGTGADDLFSVVGGISAALTSGTDPTSSLQTQLSKLDDAISSMTNALAGVGARSKRIDDALQVNSDQTIALKTQQSTVEDVDMPSTIMQLSLQQTGYQAALSVASQALQPTLVDFLR